MFNPGTKILVVDDMGTMRKLVKKNLTDMGFRTFEEAADGQLAWNKLNEHPDVGLIVSDWNMPNLSGLELLKKVRADVRFKKMAFILLTAEGEAGQVTDALTAGVDNYVLKPFDFESLKTKVLATYKKRAARGL